jgi:ABC-type uncharacterized transport system fused permease/ATPase subunit
MSLDIYTFTTRTLSIFVVLLNGLLTLAAFSWVLWFITPWLFLSAVGYAAIGCVGTIVLGRRLVTLNNEQIEREADFRYGLGRLREHAEEVAQVAGEEEQKGRLLPRLARLINNYRVVIRIARLLLASPRFAFLDDPVRSLEASLAQRLYQALAGSPITYVSAGCPPDLLTLHDIQLRLHKDGSWRVEPAGTAAAAQAGDGVGKRL